MSCPFSWSSGPLFAQRLLPETNRLEDPRSPAGPNATPVSTLYLFKRWGDRRVEMESGNYCVYALLDLQLREPNPARPTQGIYLGGSAMMVPSTFNAYDRYYEVRVYQRAPFASRPTDVLTFIASYRGHSRYVTAPLAAQGKTYWNNSQSVTGTYTLHLTR